MLTALDSEGNFVNLLENVPEKGAFICPACKGKLRLKCGKIKRPHFAHVSLQNCAVWSENESAQHLGLKAALYQWFQASGCKVEIEKYLSDLQQTPDLLVDDRIAIEVQCSHLSIARLRERTENYRAHGFQVIWLMGRDLWLTHQLTSLQRDLIYFSENCGFYFWELDLAQKELRLKSLLHQTLRGKLIYLERAFDFGEGNLLNILRLPFAAQKLQSLIVPADRNLQAFIRQQLYFRVSHWMAFQEQFYAAGKNLLTEDLTCFPSAVPIGLSALTGEISQDFCQIPHDLSNYYRNFQEYFRKNKSNTAYPPAFYKREL